MGKDTQECVVTVLDSKVLDYLETFRLNLKVPNTLQGFTKTSIMSLLWSRFGGISFRQLGGKVRINTLRRIHYSHTFFDEIHTLSFLVRY